ncbi:MULTISPECIES: aldehyde dehydrogenase [unclassified Xanthobacter]|uniref:aldehyde dehydrogenase n=1 Tax=unclassified Xanthobacter TaxID=2623496 RepID=UPI001F1E55B1|nr:MULTISPECIES: aldehyde dehydrogenase [unclassified Xanthobacter]
MPQAELLVVDDANRDDLSRKAGIFLYIDTQLWLEDGVVHRADGRALLSPDGVERWYLHGRELTRAVKTLFSQQGWPLACGLDTAAKQSAFNAHFAL